MEFKEINKESYYYDKTGMLLKGDCLDWMSKFPNKSVDMILCDLPYGTTKCYWDIVIPFDLLWEQYKRIIKDSGAIALCGSQPFTSLLVCSNIKNYKHQWIWDKKFAGNFANAKISPMKTFEDILIFGYGKINYYPQMTKRDTPITAGGMADSKSTNFGINSSFKALKKTYTEKYPEAILHFPRKLGHKNIHPTEKSVELFEYLIKTYTKENEIVLDNCSGSSTTAIASKNTNRRWICIEQDQKYCDVSVERIKNHKATP